MKRRTLEEIADEISEAVNPYDAAMNYEGPYQKTIAAMGTLFMEIHKRGFQEGYCRSDCRHTGQPDFESEASIQNAPKF